MKNLVHILRWTLILTVLPAGAAPARASTDSTPAVIEAPSPGEDGLYLGEDWLRMDDYQKRWWVSMAMIRHSMDGIPVRVSRERFVTFIDVMLSKDPRLAKEELREIFSMGLYASDDSSRAAMERIGRGAR